MPNLFLLDAGNTRIKWAAVVDGERRQQGTVLAGDGAGLRQAFVGLPAPDRILASNVAGDSIARDIVSACAAWSCAVEFITAKRNQCGVSNRYTQPTQLGSDRWAALIAAWHQVHAACIVVNCGTATTVDALSGAGEFIGGLILPGLDMMRNSLAAGTAQLGVSNGAWRDFPRNTGDAIYSGAIKATAGAIREQYGLLGAPDARCMLTGGAASLLEPHVGLPVLRAEDLVLAGLQLMGQGTE